MAYTHVVARSFIAPVFVGGGLHSLRHAEAKAIAAAPTARYLGKHGFPTDPTKLVIFNGRLQLVAGSLLLIGRLPRLASAALAVSLVPTTFAGHRFWEETDRTRKAQQRVQFTKNLAILGGLVLAATDTNGAPSLVWRAKRATRRASSTLEDLGTSIRSHVPHHESLGDRLGNVGDRAADAAKPVVHRAWKAAEHVGDSVSEHATLVGEMVAARASAAMHR